MGPRLLQRMAALMAVPVLVAGLLFSMPQAAAAWASPSSFRSLDSVVAACSASWC